jgi:protein-S-isoprenylcysteine O-methyltransferase Ste14
MSVFAPVIVFIAVLLYGLVHSLLASLEVKSLMRGWFGTLADRFYRLAYNIFATVSILPVLALPVTLPDLTLYTLRFPWALLTTALQGLAVLVLLVGLLQTGLWSFLGLEQLIKPASNKPAIMVVEGLYRWVRHPLYTAALAVIWLIPVMTRNLLALNMGLSLYLVIGAYIEERKLVREFGQVYTEYQERTPMLIPWPNRRRTKP